jgi:uncharacterized membrane protein
MTTQNKISTPRSKISLMAGVLFFSAILNLFLIGVLAGGIAHGGKHRHFGPMVLAAPYGEYMAGWVGRYLDPADAVIFHDAVQSQADALKLAHDHVRQATKDVAVVFEQDPPDAEALQTATERLSEAKAEVNDAVGKIVNSSYAKLSPEGRHRLAELTR